MAIANDDVERIRAAVSVVDVISPHVALRRVGRSWVGLCPFHAERTPSFNVREETGRYKCFGCGAGGDVFTFVQEFDHVDFVTAVETLATKAGIQIQYTSGQESRERRRRRELIEAMGEAVEWYHQRLLHAPDARGAREYLRSRGLSGEIARTFRLGWAPDGWDEYASASGVDPDALVATGLAFRNRSGRLQDQFRARVLFPIFTDTGDPVAFGGRILPGSSDPAKYKNSQETAIYSKSRTLYGLNWAKADIVTADQVIVCEGYTDVIGFHRVGVTRAVATCGTALTEEHVRILTRFASRVVLAFDADAAGQGAAERFYEWEQRYGMQVSVARMPPGADPGGLASSDPELLVNAIDESVPFLGFRVQRVLDSRPSRSPEDRARTAEAAMAVINEHPSALVRDQYASEVAVRLDLAPQQLIRIAERPRARPVVRVAPQRRVGMRETAEFIAIALLLQRWDEIAPYLVEELFADDVAHRAFVTIAAAGAEAGHSGDSPDAWTRELTARVLANADPDTREFVERAAVADLDVEPRREAHHLIAAAVRRHLAGRVALTDPEEIRGDIEVRRSVEELDGGPAAEAHVDRLLDWLHQRGEADGRAGDVDA